MAKLTMSTFLTLDGVMQAPGGPTEDPSGGFTYGGWLVPHFDEETGRFMGEVFERVDAFLLGRHTYEIFAGHWPRITDPNDPVAKALNSLPKHVASNSLERAEWAHSSIVRDVVKEVPSLKKKYARELQVHGSCGLAQTLIEHDLVDVFHLLQFPVTLGKGRRLFGPGTVPAAMKHVETRTTSKGVVITTYERAGKPTFGSFQLPD
jgi:dihydrofolate reductase